MIPPTLRPCPACGLAVSTAALMCPRCGHPFASAFYGGPPPQPPRSTGLGWLVMIPLLLALGVGGWWLLFRKGATSVSPSSLVKSAPALINEKATVLAQQKYDLQITFPPERTPGRLTGTWLSQGKSANVDGAIDDTVGSFTLRDPSNNILQQQLDSPVSGNFDFRYAGGVYVLEFNNGGIFRSSARVVTVTGTYQPD